MSGLPKLPGFAFPDPTKQRFNLCETFTFVNGYKLPKNQFTRSGGTELDSNSVAYVKRLEPLHYDPTLTYGRTRSKAPKPFLPHWALYDQKCLTFRAFFKQPVFESPDEYYKVRIVNIVYFLENDTITVMEPKTENAGGMQGRLVKRGKIPKTEGGEFWHWQDLNVGIDLCIYGIVYHTVSCDGFTKEFLRSQGVLLNPEEEMPPDRYTQAREFQAKSYVHNTPSSDDKFRRFLEYDRKILKFNAVWDDRDTEYGELRPFEIMYFLADDMVSVKEKMENCDGRDPFPLLLRKTKLPKIWTQVPVDYPSIYLERTDAEVTEYYQPKDFRVGETIFVLGRRMFLYDCDDFTRNYFKKVLNYEQSPRIDISPKPVPKLERALPPHDGFGSLEDSMQNTYQIIPTAPRKDVIKQVVNANKYLRYEMKFDAVHPEDTIRRFILKYSLGEGTCSIHEPAIRNSGIVGGRFLRETMIIKPGSDPLNPDFYTPRDFYIGALLTVYEQRFIITGADLYVYRYMQANPEKFPCEVIENMRNYMYNQGLLADDIQDKVEEYQEAEKTAQRDAIGKHIDMGTSDMDRCLEELIEKTDPKVAEYERRKREQLKDEYEQSIIHTPKVQEYGIQPVPKVCPYPITIGDVRTSDCTDMPDQSQFTPKHIDTPEEALQKHYDAIYKRHQEVCEHGKDPPCEVPPKLGLFANEPKVKEDAEMGPSPLIVQPVELPKGACTIKSVKFAEGPERCVRDRYDLCDLKTKKTPCQCTNYYQKC